VIPAIIAGVARVASVAGRVGSAAGSIGRMAGRHITRELIQGATSHTRDAQQRPPEDDPYQRRY